MCIPKISHILKNKVTNRVWNNKLEIRIISASLSKIYKKGTITKVYTGLHH